MGWIQKCYETYENNIHMAGKVVDGKDPLCPPYHIIQKVQIEITINENGSFSRAEEVPKADANTIIPVTEKSGGRSSGIAAHMLCDNLQYIALGNESYPNNEKYADKYKDFMSNLSLWQSFDPSNIKLKAIYEYCKNGQIIQDLVRSGLVKTDENGLLIKGNIASCEYEKCVVRWRVNSLTEDITAVWQDVKLFDSYSSFVAAASSSHKNICYVLGENTTVVTNHPKGIIKASNGAKLISTNDSSGFTYRGRFINGEEAVSVSNEVTQKAHGALRWLAATLGKSYGGRTYVCWNPKGKKIPSADYFTDKDFDGDDEEEEENNFAYTMPEYREKIAKALNGYKENFDDSDDVVIMSLDAATTGRLSVTYYNELKASDFLQRIYNWDESCCWFFKRFNKEKKPCNVVLTPLTMSIVNYCFGTEQGNIVKADEKLIGGQYQRIFRSITEEQPIPADIVRVVTIKASNLQAYDSENNRENILSTACALIRKYRNEKFESEDWQMSLDVHNTDRSYLFGRLLAVAEKVERLTYTREDGKRMPNAIRLQSAFVQHPMHTWGIMEKQLIPYYSKMTYGYENYYKDIISSILEVLQVEDYSKLNAGLEDIYLLGYYLQRKELNTKKDKNNTSEEEEKTEL